MYLYIYIHILHGFFLCVFIHKLITHKLIHQTHQRFPWSSSYGAFDQLGELVLSEGHQMSSDQPGCELVSCENPDPPGNSHKNPRRYQKKNVGFLEEKRTEKGKGCWNWLKKNTNYRSCYFLWVSWMVEWGVFIFVFFQHVPSWRKHLTILTELAWENESVQKTMRKSENPHLATFTTRKINELYILPKFFIWFTYLDVPGS